MRRFVRFLAAAGALLLPAAARAQASAIHEIRLEADPAADRYRFLPDRIAAHPGDLLVFRVTKGGPHSVTFEAGGISAAAHDILNGAMAARTADLSSPLLGPGAVYRIALPAALAAGTYRFYCLPHRAYDMRGELVVSRR